MKALGRCLMQSFREVLEPMPSTPLVMYCTSLEARMAPGTVDEAFGHMTRPTALRGLLKGVTRRRQATQRHSSSTLPETPLSTSIL